MFKELPTELLYLLALGAYLLFNYLMQRGAKQRQAEGPPAQLPTPEQALQEEAPPEFWGRTRESEAALTEAVTRLAPPRRVFEPVVPLLPPRRRRRFSKRSLFGTQRDVQNAVVIATILGSCRALEPPGAAAGSPSREARR